MEADECGFGLLATCAQTKPKVEQGNHRVKVKLV